MTARFVLLLLLQGCAFEVPGIDVSLDEGSQPAPDLSLIALAHQADANDPRTACDRGGSDDHCASDGRSLLSCRKDGSGFTSLSCAFGCVAGAPAHCSNLEPAGVVAAADYATATATPTITADVLFNTDGGTITGGLARSAGSGLKNGISFRLISQPGTSIQVGVFGFGALSPLCQHA